MADRDDVEFGASSDDQPGADLARAQAEAAARREADDAEFQEGWGLSLDDEPEQTFAQAMAAARTRGDDKFTWRGKTYATTLRAERTDG